MAEILVRSTNSERDRIKTKAKAAKLSMSAYLLKKGLDDKRARDTEDAVTLSNLYAQLLELNQNLKALLVATSTDDATPQLSQSSEGSLLPEAGASLLRDAIALCQEVGREVVLYRLARQVEQNR